MTLGETLQAEASRICDAALVGQSKRIAMVYLCDRRTGTEAFACASAGIPSGSDAKGQARDDRDDPSGARGIGRELSMEDFSDSRAIRAAMTKEELQAAILERIRSGTFVPPKDPEDRVKATAAEILRILNERYEEAPLDS